MGGNQRSMWSICSKVIRYTPSELDLFVCSYVVAVVILIVR